MARMVSNGKKMIITGKTKKTKERIKNHGSEWVFLRKDYFRGQLNVLLLAKDQYIAWFSLSDIEIKD